MVAPEQILFIPSRDIPISVTSLYKIHHTKAFMQVGTYLSVSPHCIKYITQKHSCIVIEIATQKIAVTHMLSKVIGHRSQ